MNVAGHRSSGLIRGEIGGCAGAMTQVHWTGYRKAQNFRRRLGELGRAATFQGREIPTSRREAWRLRAKALVWLENNYGRARGGPGWGETERLFARRTASRWCG